MRSRPFHTLATWLCLAATLLMGISPGQGWVLCFEPDGTVSFEAASDADTCGGCPEQEQGSNEPIVPVSEPADCPCIDVPLTLASDQDRVAPKRVEQPVAALALLPVALVEAIQPAPVPLASRPAVPRPVASLALIRSVVLLV